MKKLIFTLALACIMLNNLTHAQIGNSTYYYDYFSNPQVAYANDMAEDMVTDAADNMFVAGEEQKETSAQAVHVIKYNGAGTVLTQGTYDNLNYKEYVKKIVYDGSTYLYVVCNAVHVTTGAQALLVLKYSATSLVTPLSADYFTSYNSPVDAVIAGSGINGYLFVACKKPNGTATSLAVVRLTKNVQNNSMLLQYSFAYNFLNTSDQYLETPKDLLYSQTDQAVYVAGGIRDTVSGKTASLVIRLATTLTGVYSIAGTLDSGQNVYNSVALNSSYVFVAGSQRNNPNNKHSWVIRRLNKSTGATINSRSFNPGTSFYSEALKITLADASNILVAGYAKDATTSVYNVQIGKYAADLTGGAYYYGSTLAYNSTLRDAVSSSTGVTYLTGSKANGSKQNMFLLGFHALTGGTNFYRDSIVNLSAGGNKVVLLSSGTNMFAVAGYQDKSNNAFQPHDYKMMTRIYSYIIERVEDKKEDVWVSVFPNPATDFIHIKSTTAIRSYRLFDMQGRILAEGTPSDETTSLEIPIMNQPNGIYFLTVNDGKAQKIIKN